MAKQETLQGIEYLNSSRKTKLDLIMATAVLTPTIGIWPIVTIYNWSRREPLFYTQKRLGKNRQLFNIYKFDTLGPGVPTDYAGVHSKRNVQAPTRLSQLLRKTGFNELPQMVQVIYGLMSVVGPRALPPIYVEEVRKEYHAEEVDEWEEIIGQIKPGVLGVSPGRSKIALVGFAKRKAMEIGYTKTATVGVDMKIFLQAMTHFWHHE